MSIQIIVILFMQTIVGIQIGIEPIQEIVGQGFILNWKAQDRAS